MSTRDVRAACLLLNSEEETPSRPVRLCVVDLGTNSFHAVIVDAHPNGSFDVVDRFKEMVRIGEGALVTSVLTEPAMKRGVKALQRIRILAEGWNVEEYLAYATSAIREAKNGGRFIERVRKEVGILIRPITGSLEAELIYRGVKRAVDVYETSLFVDIGGGSTECIVADAETVHYSNSFKIGAARMTERFITSDPVDASEFRRLRAYYRSVLHPVFEAAREHGVRQVIGSSGTLENIAQLTADREGEPGRSIFHQVFSRSALRETTKQLMKSSSAERELMAGIDAKRIDQVVAGAILSDVIIKDLGIEQMLISSNALREGMVLHYIDDNTKRLRRIAPYGSVRRRSIYEVAYRFRWEAAHARQVTAMALQLFDACSSLHGLGETERELLEYAALLHDIGYHISRNSHHKHSRYLIQNADLRGFLPEEVEIMAHVARYHRGALPKRKHTMFMELEPEHREIVRKLAALLKLANGMDRSHVQNVQEMRTELGSEDLRIQIHTKGDPQLDVWGGQRGSDLFERVYRLPVNVRGETERPPSEERAEAELVES